MKRIAPASLAAPRRAIPTIPRLRRPRPRSPVIPTNDLFVGEVLEADMKIGVSGASGHLGRAVVSELLQRRGGHEGVALTRAPATRAGTAQGRVRDQHPPQSAARA